MKILIIVLSCLFLGGCNKNLYQEVYDNIAEIRNIMYEGEDKDGQIYASLMCGEREEEYILNGAATNLIPFGIITFKCDTNIQKVEYILKANGNTYSGELQKNPFEDNFMADIGEIVVTDYVLIKFLWEDSATQVKMNRIDTGFKHNIDSVIKNVVGKYEKELKTFRSKNTFNGEVYIKIIAEGYNVNAEKMWYVNIISGKGDSLSIVLSPENMQVLSIQKNLNNS